MSRVRCLIVACALLAALALGACGGDGEDQGADAPESTSATSTEQQPETEAQETEETAGADTEEQLEIEAQGTAEAFVIAVEDDDEQVFCGIVNQEFLDKFFKEFNLDAAGCQKAFEGVEFNAFSFLEGATVGTADTVVDGPVAVVTLETGPNRSSLAVMRREGDRFLIKDLQAP